MGEAPRADKITKWEGVGVREACGPPPRNDQGGSDCRMGLSESETHRAVAGTNDGFRKGSTHPMGF
jgi:hypothetical protein